MPDEYYRVLKLKTGETLLCSLEQDIVAWTSESYLILHHPVRIVNMIIKDGEGNAVGEGVTLKPWIGMSTNDEFRLGTEMLVTMGELDTEFARQYVNYVRNEQEGKQAFRDHRERQQAIYDLFKSVAPDEEPQIITLPEELPADDHSDIVEPTDPAHEAY